MTPQRLRLNWLAPTLSSLLCLLPLLLHWDRFRTLYWFHDDWDLISEMESLGTVGWMTQPYGENFVPVFKLFWEGAIVLVQGSYLGMILVLWSTHLAILLLLAALMRRCGFPGRSQSLAVLTLGMPWSNIETLGWAACWISPLTILFFLLAWVLLLSSESKGGSKWLAVGALVCALASALSFSRGVFTGALLAFFILHTSLGERRFNRGHLWTAVCLAIITGVSLFPYRWMAPDYGNFQELNGQKLSAMVSYGAHYALLSPLYHLLPIPHKTVALRELIITGTLKALILAAGLIASKGRQRTVLWTLLLFDTIMAGLLGLGRYQMGIGTAVSYRYQYPSLLCFAPFFAIAVMKGLQALSRPTSRNVAFAVIFVGWAGLLGYPWKRHSERWAGWRGTEVRTALASALPDQRFGFATITAGRARELIKLYNLH